MIDRYPVLPTFKIISSGQHGADAAALDWAIHNQIDHGGWRLKRRKSKADPIDPRFRLDEVPTAGTLRCTEWNVRDSDATLVFTEDDRLDGASRCSADFAGKLGKPWMHFRPGVHPKYLARFLAFHQVRVLHVSGTCPAETSRIETLVSTSLDAALCPPDASRPADVMP